MVIRLKSQLPVMCLPYRFNGWTLDINSRSLINPSAVAYRLPRSEFRAVAAFCENPGQIQTRADLCC